MEPQRNATVIGLKGESVRLPCLISDGRQQPTDRFVLTWFKGSAQVYSYYSGSAKGHPTAGFEGRLRHAINNTLLIEDIQPSDRGTYQCSISEFNKPVDKVVGRLVTLEVRMAPVITKSTKSPVYKLPGDRLELYCEADGYPVPNVFWQKFKDKGRDKKWERIQPGDRVTITPTSLIISKLEERDTGKYACSATIPNAPVARKELKVVFHTEPRFEQPPTNRTALDGYQLLWQCRATAEPNNIVYNWYYGDRKIIYANSLGLRSKIQTTGDLLITKVRKEDTGWYTCTVSSGNFEKSASAYLDVQYPPQILPSTSGIQRLPLGLPGSLTCDVDANPTIAHITWTHRGMVLVFPTSMGGGEDNPPRYITASGAKLNFLKVAQTDAGPYTCQAFNTHGNSPVFEIHAIVQDPPVYLEVSEGEFVRRVGESVSLKCSAAGSPTPFVRWIRKGKGYEAGGRPISQVGQSTLSIEQIRKEDHGRYACVVKNDVATLSKEAELIIRDTSPQPPENVTVVSRAFQATVSFTPGYNGGFEQTFELKYKEKGTGEWLTYGFSGGQTSATVRMLKPVTFYHYKVVPKNIRGEGTPSEEIVVQTLEPNYAEDSLPMDLSGSTYIPVTDKSMGPKPDPPANLQIQAEKEHLVLSWKPPSQRHLKIPYYTVEYKENTRRHSKLREPQENVVRSEDFKPLGQQVVGHTSMKVATKSLFAPGSTYDFQVKSHSLTSVSDPSNIVTFAMPGVSPQMALIAGIVGGLIFLLLCLVLVGIGVRCSKRHKKPTHNGICNGHHKQENGNGRYVNSHMLDEFGTPYPPVKATIARLKDLLLARISRLTTTYQRRCQSECKATGWYFRRDLSTSRSQFGETESAGVTLTKSLITTAVGSRTSQALYSTLRYTRDKLMVTVALIRSWNKPETTASQEGVIQMTDVPQVFVTRDCFTSPVSSLPVRPIVNCGSDVEPSVADMFHAQNYLIQCKPYVHQGHL